MGVKITRKAKFNNLSKEEQIEYVIEGIDDLMTIFTQYKDKLRSLK